MHATCAECCTRASHGAAVNASGAKPGSACMYLEENLRDERVVYTEPELHELVEERCGQPHPRQAKDLANPHTDTQATTMSALVCV
jgi:hypothetical protein